MSTRQANPDFLNGVPELVVLQLLGARPMHGYDLVQAIRTTSAGKLSFPEGSIYPVLHRLEAEKILSSRKEEVGGRTRIIYRLTASGRTRLAGSLANWRQIVAGIEAILEGEGHAQPGLA